MDRMRKIGILESDLAMRKLLQEVLNKEGFQTPRVFENPQQVKDPDVNLDVLLASVSDLLANGGTDLVEMTSTHPAMSVVIVTPHENRHKAEKLVETGAFALIQRPFQPWDLIHTVRLGSEIAELKRRNEWLRRKEVREPNAELKSIIDDEPSLDELEKRYIEIVLKKTGGRKDKASKLLGINRRTLYRKEREYGWVSSGKSPTLVNQQAAQGG